MKKQWLFEVPPTRTALPRLLPRHRQIGFKQPPKELLKSFPASEWDLEFQVPVNRKSRTYVQWVQHNLNRLMGAGLVVDGIAGSRTRQAVVRFQQKSGITADGIVGSQTERALIAAGASPLPILPSPDVTPGKLVYEDKVSENKAAFIAKVRAISGALSIKPDWLMALMNHESGLDHRKPNPYGGATGLIQFMPATAKRLGTTTEALRSMSNVEQLDYVYKYFAPYKGRIRSYSDLYLITFYPYALGKPDSYVFGSERSPEHARKITSQNKGIDLNNDGVIAMGEFKQWIYQGIPSQIRSRLN